MTKIWSMDKCWFVLPRNQLQTQYPPPTTTVLEDGKECQSGALCLGDMIPNLKHLDHRINAGPMVYPLDMPVLRTSSGKLTWTSGTDGTREIKGSFEAPALAAALGVELGSHLSLAMNKSIQQCWEIEETEVMIIQPRKPHLDLVLAQHDVAQWVDEHSFLGAWTAFMITGLIIARGKTSARGQGSAGPNISTGSNVGIPEVVSASADLTYSTANKSTVSRAEISDFVWAVRLAKVSKGIFDKTWSVETYSYGATHGTDRASIELREQLVKERIEYDEEIVTDTSGVFVLLR